MKQMALALVLGALLCACTAEGVSAGSAEGYTLSLSALDAEDKGEELVLLIRAEDGRAAAAMIEGGASTLIEPAEAEALLADSAATLERDAPLAKGESAENPTSDRVSLRLPGVSIEADSREGGADRARVSLGFGKHQIQVDAHDGETNGNDRALVRISGADAKAAREFIEKQDGLSTEVRRQLLEKLGLGAS